MNEEQQFLDDWEGERETKAQPEPIQVPAPIPAPVNEPKAEKQKKTMPPDISAEIFIGAIDTTQMLVFGALNKRKIRSRFTGEEIAKAEKILQQIKDKDINKKELSDADYDLQYEYKRLKEIQDDIPFTDEEYEILKKPLAKLIEINGYDIPPGLAMTMAAAQVFAPRLVDAIFE